MAFFNMQHDALDFIDPMRSHEVSGFQPRGSVKPRRPGRPKDMTLCVDTSTHWFDVEQARSASCGAGEVARFPTPVHCDSVAWTAWRGVAVEHSGIGRFLFFPRDWNPMDTFIISFRVR